MTAFALFPESPPLALGELTTFSYSTFREQTPVRPLGRISTKGYGKGSRTVAGTMVFTVYHKHIIYKIKEHAEFLNIKRLKTDELPPFDMVITFGNEYGATAKITIYGITVVDEGGVFSVEDMYSENTMSYVARDIDLMYGPVGNSAESRYMPDSYGKIVDAFARFASNPNDFVLPAIHTTGRSPNLMTGSHHGTQPNNNVTHAPAAGMGEEPEEDPIDATNIIGINVRVRNAAGHPLENVSVSMLNHKKRRWEVVQALTDRNGAASLRVDPGERSEVSVGASLNGVLIGEGTAKVRRGSISRIEINTAIAQVISRIVQMPEKHRDIQMVSVQEKPETLTVRVLDPDGNTIQGIDVVFSYTIGAQKQVDFARIKTNVHGTASTELFIRNTISAPADRPFTGLEDGTIVTASAHVAATATSERLTAIWRFEVVLGLSFDRLERQNFNTASPFIVRKDINQLQLVTRLWNTATGGISGATIRFQMFTSTSNQILGNVTTNSQGTASFDLVTRNPDGTVLSSLLTSLAHGERVSIVASPVSPDRVNSLRPVTWIFQIHAISAKQFQRLEWTSSKAGITTPIRRDHNLPTFEVRSIGTDDLPINGIDIDFTIKIGNNSATRFASRQTNHNGIAQAIHLSAVDRAINVTPFINLPLNTRILVTAKVNPSTPGYNHALDRATFWTFVINETIMQHSTHFTTSTPGLAATTSIKRNERFPVFSVSTRTLRGAPLSGITIMFHKRIADQQKRELLSIVDTNNAGIATMTPNFSTTDIPENTLITITAEILVSQETEMRRGAKEWQFLLTN